MANPKENSTLAQIKTTAGLYPPATYGLGSISIPSFLTYYKDLELHGDSHTSHFIPFTSVRRNTKLFAVGILPPTQTVGRLQDHSESIIKIQEKADLYRGAPSQDDFANPDLLIEEDIRAEIGVPSGTIAPDRIQARNEAQLATLQAGFMPLVRRHIQLAAQRGITLVITQSNRTNAEQDALYARGRNGDTRPKVTNAQGGESWHNYGLAVDYAVYNPRTRKTEIPPPPGSAISEIWGVVGAIGVGIGLNWGKNSINKDDMCHFDWHPGLTSPPEAKGVVFDAPTTIADRPVESDTTQVRNWSEDGSRAARKSDEQQSTLAQTDISADPLERFRKAQEAQILAAKRALDSMANAPPLRLLVNPNKFSVKSQKIVQDGNWGRNGPIVEFWGDDQDKISGSGQIAAFYSLLTNPSLGQGGPGLTRAARNHSEAWQNLQSLWLLYRNNGGLYTKDVSQQDRDSVLSTVGSVYIFYDNILYIGCFDSFNISETDTKPFTAEYSFEFTVRVAFLLDFPPEDTFEQLQRSRRVRPNFAI